MPVVFPGFSWNNMLPPGRPSSTIPRNEGSFLWKQLNGATSQGAQMIYVAMFDEIDEAQPFTNCPQRACGRKQICSAGSGVAI
jgi:hypothetical protein